MIDIWSLNVIDNRSKLLKNFTYVYHKLMQKKMYIYV